MRLFTGARRRGVARSLTVAAAALGGTLAVAAPASADDAPRDPVLFVHGFTRSSADFAAFKANFLANGYREDQLFTIDYNSLAPNVYAAYAIRDKVDAILAQTNKKYVDIVTHSMGAFGTRYYLANLGGQAKVDAFISIGGPNHGTYAATPLAGAEAYAQCLMIPSCVEMAPGSAFLTGLNAVDETPNAPKTKVRYFTMRTLGDDLVIPSSSTELDGATNWVHPDAALTHMQLAVDTTTIDQSRAFIANS